MARTPARPRKPAVRRATKPRAPRAIVRMYRQGLGDCFLVTLPRPAADGGPFRIMIDCGVLLGTPDAKEMMTKVAADIAGTSNGKVDLLIVTHEHWDHVSGFLQAREALQGIQFGAVWMGWTESPDDPQAKRLDDRRKQALNALRLADSRMQLAGAADPELSDLLGFFGAAGNSTRDALQAARALAPPGGLRYAEPGEKPTAPAGSSARLYVLGPPRNEALLLRSDPSGKAPETYHFGFAGFSMDEAEKSLTADEPTGPFGPAATIPLAAARGMPAFRRYFADGSAGAGEAWRRIDTAWLDGAADLALRLDHDTNNTSLAIAIELDNDDVLLFAADAQVGNWLSWQTLTWDVDGRAVTGPDLLARTIFYKVGHHGSHNATLREQGLERMTRLQAVAIPVDQAIATKRGWNRMPLDSLLARLAEKTNGRVLRSDHPAPHGIPGLIETDLFFELTF